ncbi:PREDICTED: testis-specific serine kinase substrate [Crocodylus porosus]|uniref:testis-specific serine kinase substrate n=1 Tax=Crocodylus porosus TaxID=8502 RepID=UPI00093EAF57|nr:PREDICTED: testis-specific serine kinase substrate [Crocodylus porosus]
MAYVVVKTIWQSKEINEAGDPPSGAETQAQSARDLLGKAGAKAPLKKKKAVSFHGVEPPLASEGPPSRLNLKRSSACTNVSLLNLTDGERDDSTESTDDSPSRGPLHPPDPAGSEDDTDAPTPVDMATSGLVRAKDSVTSLKERASRVNRRVQSLQSECSMLCENLERRRREAEDLEEHCTRLQESCRKVSQSVEDAEIKTSLLKKNSVLLEEKLRSLQRQAQGGELSWPDPEALGIPKPFLEVAGGSLAPQGCPVTPEDEEDEEGSTTEALNSLQEVPVRTWDRRLEGLQLESSLGLLKWLERLRAQWEHDWQEQSQCLQGQLDEASTMAKCTALSLTQLQSDLEELRQIKPLLEDLSWQLGALRGLEVPSRATGTCASQGCAIMESLRQMVERAVAPVLEELKQRGGTQTSCPSCQRLHSKILDLEQEALETHTQVETLNSSLRLAQDEALRAKTYLEQAWISPQEKPLTLDPLHTRLSSLQTQLSAEGIPLGSPKPCSRENHSLQ